MLICTWYISHIDILLWLTFYCGWLPPCKIRSMRTNGENGGKIRNTECVLPCSAHFSRSVRTSLYGKADTQRYLMRGVKFHNKAAGKCSWRQREGKGTVRVRQGNGKAKVNWSKLRYQFINLLPKGRAHTPEHEGIPRVTRRVFCSSIQCN